jgi:hypothetical protein
MSKAHTEPAELATQVEISRKATTGDTKGVNDVIQQLLQLSEQVSDHQVCMGSLFQFFSK